jgi:hypothetical protein
MNVKCQSPNTYQSNDIAKVKVFNQQVKQQSQGHKVKHFKALVSINQKI